MKRLILGLTAIFLTVFAMVIPGANVEAVETAQLDNRAISNDYGSIFMTRSYAMLNCNDLMTLPDRSTCEEGEYYFYRATTNGKNHFVMNVDRSGANYMYLIVFGINGDNRFDATDAYDDFNNEFETNSGGANYVAETNINNDSIIINASSFCLPDFGNYETVAVGYNHSRSHESSEINLGLNSASVDNYINSNAKIYVLSKLNDLPTKVIDTTNPVINTLEQTFFYRIDNAPILDEIKANFTATDIEDGDITSKLVFESNYDRTKIGVYTIKATVSDSYGNSTTVTNNIHLVDALNPIITAQKVHNYDVKKYSKEQVLEFIKATITYTDNYDLPEALKITFTDNINVSVIGKYAFEVTAIDTSGNNAMQSIIVNIIDAEKAVITAPDKLTYSVGQYTNDQILALIKEQINITDNYNSLEQLIITYTNNIDAAKLGVYGLTVKVLDTSNNESAYTIPVEIVDTVAPTITPSFTGNNLKGTYIPTEAQLKALFTFSDNYNSLEELTITFTKNPTIEKNVWGSYEFEISVSDTSGNVSKFAFTYEYFDGNAPVIYVSGTVHVDSTVVLTHSMIIGILKQLGLLDEYKSVSFLSKYFDTPNVKGDYVITAEITLLDDTVKTEEIKLSVFEVSEKVEGTYFGFFKRLGNFFAIIFNFDKNYRTPGFWNFFTKFPNRCGQAWDVLVKNKPYIVKTATN